MTDEAPPTPTSEAVSSNGVANSPHSRRQVLQSPWASVVRGDSEQIPTPTPAAIYPEQVLAVENPLVESSAPEAQSESADVNGDSNGGRSRRPAWNRPVNGVVEASPPLSDSVVWPPLSLTRSGARSGPDSIRPVSDGSASSSQAPLLSQPPQRPANTNVHAHTTSNNTVPNRPRLRNRTSGGGGGNSSGGGGPSQSNFNRPTAPSPPPFPGMEGTYAIGPPPPPPLIETAVRGPRPIGGNDHNSPRNRRGGNYGPRPRGDGPYHNNHGRRDHDRMEVHLPPAFGPHPPMGYMHPLPPGGAPFMQPLTGGRLFPGPMGFVPDMPPPYFYVHPESYRLPLVPAAMAPPPVVFPPADEPLADKILHQIEYYFSDDNMVKDTYLRSNMDGHGWVPLALIAKFPRVERMTTEMPVILDALSSSQLVEVQDEKIRRRGDWSRWLTSSSVNNEASSSNSNGPTTSVNAIATSLQGVSLNDTTQANGNMQGHTEMATGEALHEELPNGVNVEKEENPSFTQ